MNCSAVHYLESRKRYALNPRTSRRLKGSNRYEIKEEGDMVYDWDNLWVVKNFILLIRAAMLDI